MTTGRINQVARRHSTPQTTLGSTRARKPWREARLPRQLATHDTNTPRHTDACSGRDAHGQTSEAHERRTRATNREAHSRRLTGSHPTSRAATEPPTYAHTRTRKAPNRVCSHTHRREIVTPSPTPSSQNDKQRALAASSRAQAPRRGA